MKTNNSWNFYSILVFALVFVLATVTSCQGKTIQVGLAQGVASAQISGSNISGRNRRGANFSVGGSGSFSAKNGSVIFNGKSYSSPVTLSARSALQYGSVKYGGAIVLAATKNSLTVINQIELEQYLQGILKMEMNHQWPMEALKAQAIISRTFALRGLNRHSKAGYNLCNAAHCQVYRGLNAKDQRCDQAVASTNGQVLTYNGELAQTFFHSYSGGSTADVSHVWGGKIPYLTVRTEPFEVESPRKLWETTFSALEIESALAKENIRLGKLKTLSIVQRDSAGRPVTLRFDGTAGSAELSSHAFRMAIGASKLGSTAFELKGATAAASTGTREVSRRRGRDISSLTAEQEQQLDELMKQKKFSSADLIDMLVHPERRLHYLRRETGMPPAPPPSPSMSAPEAAIVELYGGRQNVTEPLSKGSTVQINGAVTFQGRGWGHGVGLSQWGAKAMADHGWSCEKILQYYYPGTALQKWQ